MELRILKTEPASAASNMDLDAHLLETLDPKGEPILHLYGWERPSLTFGYFCLPEKYLDLSNLARRNLDSARRPTGGGIVFHIWDLAFSFLMPSNHPAFSINTLENYRFVNEAVLEAVLPFLAATEKPEILPKSLGAQSADCSHFCMARPTQYDVVYQGRKVAGAAQRRRKQGYLHQGTISLGVPDISLLREVLLSKEAVLEAMLSYTFTPNLPLEDARASVQKNLTEKLQDKLSFSYYEHT